MKIKGVSKMFQISKSLKEKLTTLRQKLQPQPAGIQISAYCSTCEGGCLGNCVNMCKGACDGGCMGGCYGTSVVR